jgi:hypothetical protein
MPQKWHGDLFILPFNIGLRWIALTSVTHLLASLRTSMGTSQGKSSIEPRINQLSKSHLRQRKLTLLIK